MPTKRPESVLRLRGFPAVVLVLLLVFAAGRALAQQTSQGQSGPTPGSQIVPTPGSQIVPMPGSQIVPTPGSQVVPMPGSQFVPRMESEPEPIPAGQGGCSTPCCGCPAPRYPWYIRTEGLALRREVLENTTFTEAGTVVAGGVVPTGLSLTHDDLPKPFEAGGRFLLGYTFDDSPFQLELSFFSLNQWDTSGGLVDSNDIINNKPGNLFSPFTHFGNPSTSPAVDFNYSVQVHEISYLDNAELNLKQLLPMPSGLLTTNILFGLRHINVREVFDYNSQPAPAPSTLGSPVTVNAHTINDIYGAQIGALFEVNAASNAWISFEIKGALCDNAASRDLNASVSGIDTNHPRLSEAQTVYVGDFNLAAYWRPTQHVTARIGYQAIWIDGLALAEENFHPNLASLISTTIQPPLNCSGTVLYHGPYAGLELHW